VVALAVVAFWQPDLVEKLGLTDHKIALYVLGIVIVIRLLMAPYWAYEELALKVPLDADVSGDWKISESLDYIVNDSVAELRQPGPNIMEFGPEGGRRLIESGVQYEDARAKMNESLISGELQICGLRQIRTHIPNQFELTYREIPKNYCNDMQLNFSTSLDHTVRQSQTTKIPGKSELDHWTGLHVSKAQIKRKWSPKPLWRRCLERLARKPRIRPRPGNPA
jgi:hypothetical protein